MTLVNSARCEGVFLGFTQNLSKLAPPAHVGFEGSVDMWVDDMLTIGVDPRSVTCEFVKSVEQRRDFSHVTGTQSSPRLRR